MNATREITSGAVGGLVTGLVLRTIVALWAIPAGQELESPAAPLRQASDQPDVAQADIRQAATDPSADARAAVESGSVKFVIRPGANSNDKDVANILMRLGALPLSQSGETVCVWKADQWEPIRTSEDLAGYAVGRAWELPRREALGLIGAKLPPSALAFLVLPTEQEMRLVGAVEKALKKPLAGHRQIVLTVEETPGGHIRWTLQRAIQRDNTEIVPNTPLPI